MPSPGYKRQGMQSSHTHFQFFASGRIFVRLGCFLGEKEGSYENSPYASVISLSYFLLWHMRFFGGGKGCKSCEMEPTTLGGTLNLWVWSHLRYGIRSLKSQEFGWTNQRQSNCSTDLKFGSQNCVPVASRRYLFGIARCCKIPKSKLLMNHPGFLGWRNQ